MSDTKHDDGGTAFPVGSLPINRGISKRDYFAAHALNSVYFDSSRGSDRREAEDMARLAYLVADAMLAERAK